MGKNLATSILNTLQKFYPNKQLGISIMDIDTILNKGSITINNVKKDEIVKIIKILKIHIENSMNNIKNNTYTIEDNAYTIEDNAYTIEDNKYTIQDNKNKEEKINMDYYNNLEKIRQLDLKVKQKKKELPSTNDRQKIENNIIPYDIIIDSFYRNIEKYSNPSEYTINISKEDDENIFCIKTLTNLENILSVELLECQINDNLFNDDFYIILEIDEVGKNVLSNNPNLRNCFAVLNDFNIHENFKGKYRNYKIPPNTIKIFKPEKNFSSISIRLKNSKGELLVYNRENSGEEFLLNSFKLRLKKIEKKSNNFLF